MHIPIATQLLAMAERHFWDTGSALQERWRTNSRSKSPRLF